MPFLTPNQQRQSTEGRRRQLCQQTHQLDENASCGGIPYLMMAFRNALRCRVLNPSTCQPAQTNASITPTNKVLNCYAAESLGPVPFFVNWLSSGAQSDEVLVWLSASCRLFAYGPADATGVSKPHHLLPRLHPDWFYLSGTSLPTLSWKRGR